MLWRDMALPRDLKTLFDDLPAARAARTEREQQAVRDRETAEAQRLEAEARARTQLRSEFEVVWDWLQTDGQELAGEMKKAGFMRMQLVGPLDRDGREVPWQLDARVYLLNDDGLVEVVRQDSYRELRYPVRTLEDFISIEPPGTTRAFIDAVRSGAVWRRVADQIRESTAPRVDEE
ncbi:MAG: hypothetical protein QM817_14625 [Archangium sp.]